MHCRYAGYPVCEDTRFFDINVSECSLTMCMKQKIKKLSISEQGFIHTLDGSFLGITSLFLYLKNPKHLNLSLVLSFYLETKLSWSDTNWMLHDTSSSLCFRESELNAFVQSAKL